MTVETCLGVEGTLVGDFQLIDCIVVDFGDLLWLIKAGSCQTTERQSHEDTVEPNLIGIDGLVPEYFIGNGAWLVLQLLHHGLHGLEILGLWVELIHSGDEMTGTDIVEIVIENIIASDITIGVNHRVGIFLTILTYLLTTIFEIGVEHAFEFDTHHIAPLGLFREIEQITLRHTFHLRIGEPLAVVLVGLLLQHQ